VKFPHNKQNQNENFSSFIFHGCQSSPGAVGEAYDLLPINILYKGAFRFIVPTAPKETVGKMEKNDDTVYWNSVIQGNSCT
jgi:hypothetical protein